MLKFDTKFLLKTVHTNSKWTLARNFLLCIFFPRHLHIFTSINIVYLKHCIMHYMLVILTSRGHSNTRITGAFTLEFFFLTCTINLSWRGFFLFHHFSHSWIHFYFIPPSISPFSTKNCPVLKIKISEKKKTKCIIRI